MLRHQRKIPLKVSKLLGSQWKQQDYEARSTSANDLNKFFNILKNAGADFIHCSNRRFWEGEFEPKTKLG